MQSLGETTYACLRRVSLIDTERTLSLQRRWCQNRRKRDDELLVGGWVGTRNLVIGSAAELCVHCSADGLAERPRVCGSHIQSGYSAAGD